MEKKSKLLCVIMRKLFRQFSTKVKDNVIKRKPDPGPCKKQSKELRKKKKDPSSNQPHCQPSKAFWEDFPPPKQVNVSLHGVNYNAGQTAAFLLKQHELIYKLYINGRGFTDNIANDLNAIDTNCKVETFETAAPAADIAVLVDTDQKEKNMEEKFHRSCCRVISFIENCSLYCPRAILLICVEPICCTIPLAQKILEETPWFHPSRLIGNVAHLQNHINSAAADYLNLDPTSIHIPLIGGPDSESVLPLISSMDPKLCLVPHESKTLHDILRKIILHGNKCSTEKLTNMDEGYAIARMVITIAKGLCGQSDAIASAFVRTNVLTPYKHLVTTVRFGEGGVCDNYGIPKLTKFEMKQFEKSLSLLRFREKIWKTV